MVDTSLRPRPSFGTFLQSENDGFSYNSYQRLLRSKKVALLQEKKRQSSESGSKKPSKLLNSPSRRIFQLKSKDSASLKLTIADKSPCKLLSETKPNDKLLHQIPSLVNIEDPSTETKNKDVDGNDGTKRLPCIKSKARLIKSATARDYHLSSPSHAKVERPKTVSGMRSVGEVCTQGVQTDSPITVYESRPHKTESSTQVVDFDDPKQNEIEALVRAYTWRTSSQRATDEIGWNERIPSPSIPRPASTVEQFPDPVSMRLTFRRYHSEPAEWQCFGTEWDSIQSRPGSSSFIRGPQSIVYSNSNQTKQQLPGYYGHVPNNQLMDTQTSNRHRVVCQRSSIPRPTNTSRQANIPGYTGCIHWSAVEPAHSDMLITELTTSARIHRHIPIEEERSPFIRTGVFSKMIKTVSPFNPHNKI